MLRKGLKSPLQLQQIDRSYKLTFCSTKHMPLCSSVVREYSTYRVVNTSRLEAPRHLVVHDNLRTFIKYSERSVQNQYKWLASVKCILYALGHCTMYTI